MHTNPTTPDRPDTGHSASTSVGTYAKPCRSDVVVDERTGSLELTQRANGVTVAPLESSAGDTLLVTLSPQLEGRGHR